MKRVVCLFVCVLAVLGRAEAADRTVCASGCQYNALQPAIDAAVPGDVILLRAGETFVGNVVLRAKDSASTDFITIRSDAPDSSLPGDGVRLIPSGKSGANVASGTLARLLGKGGNWQSVQLVRTEPGAHHYRLQFLDIDGTANQGYETLVSFGQNVATQTAATAPHHLVLDRVFIHGHATKGSKRGIMMDSRDTEVLNSYISDIKSLADAQAIAIANGPGPFKIYNNYLEAAAENFLSGGSDPKVANLVPSDIDIRWNHFTKNPAWQSTILATPGQPSVSAGTGGSLSAGTYYFKVVAVISAGGSTGVSTPSAEASVNVGASGAVTLSWSAVSGADSYRVYGGTSPNGENVYMQTTATSVTYTGAGQTSGAPQKSGDRWTCKNLLELKNAQRVTIDGNLFENNWGGFQVGHAILFTPKNQEGTAPWSVVKDVTFTNNIVRHVTSGIDIAGKDYQAPSQVATNFRIANNLFYDILSAYGNAGKFMTITDGPKNITFDHNTVVQEGILVETENVVTTGFVFTNNYARHNTYGVKGSLHGSGTDTLNYFFPGYVFTGNVLGGGPAKDYPAGNYFPTMTEFNAAFVDPANGNYALRPGTAFSGVAPDGTDIGINAVALEAAQLGAVTGNGVPPPPPPPQPPVTPPADTLPSGWQSQDVGAVGTPGSASANAGVFTVRGAGNDIWGSADSFHFAYVPLAGDGVIVARVASINGIDPWTKVGVMIRATTAANSVHASMFVSIGKGLAFQRRRTTGSDSTHTSGGPGTAPRWVRLQRAGNTITASVSTDGVAWTVVGNDTITMPNAVLAGLAVTSRYTATPATGTFDNVSITSGASLPSGWQSSDIGAVGLSGSASGASGVFTVTGAGADVWGTADALQFASTTVTGDGDIVARVASLSGTQAWTKVGVMIRGTLDAGSAQAFMLVSLGKGTAFQRRTVTGGTSVHTAGPASAAPRWVRLSRRGQTITASVSADGAAWTTVGSDTFSIVGPAQFGLAVSSHDPAQRATGVFDSVAVTPVP